jgi:acyl-CoA synthetase (AMP-forming)/AMP-acid ligase II
MRVINAGLGSLTPYFMLGGTTVLHPLGAFNATEWLDAVEREQATAAFCMPVQWRMICQEPTVKQRKLALRVLCWGAAPASDTVLRAMADCFPDARNVAVFGQTEMSARTTRDRSPGPHRGRHPHSAGFATRDRRHVSILCCLRPREVSCRFTAVCWPWFYAPHRCWVRRWATPSHRIGAWGAAVPAA